MIKALTIHHYRDAVPGWDYCHGIEGELAVYMPIDCHNPECDCERSFVGLNSHKGSTTARVTELDMTVDDMVFAARGYLIDAGWADYLSDTPETIAAKLIDGALTQAADYPVGTVLELYYDAADGWMYYRDVAGRVADEEAV